VLRPESARPVHWRGWVLERLNNPKSARIEYERALTLDPDLLAARLRLVEMLLEDKQAGEAAPHLAYLCRQAPDDPRVRARLGMCRLLEGRSDEGRELLEAALPALPTDAPLLIALANLNAQQGRAAEAERLLRVVLAADPVDTEALFALSSALVLQNRPAEARAVLAEHESKRATMSRINTLLKDVADSPTATPDDYAELGALCLQIGRDKVALYWLNRALERDPNAPRAHRALAEYHDGKGDRAQAEAHRRKVKDAPRPPAAANGGVETRP
jgi:tetratricopeptide (TPR) repeat protein